MAAKIAINFENYYACIVNYLLFFKACVGVFARYFSIFVRILKKQHF